MRHTNRTFKYDPVLESEEDFRTDLCSQSNPWSPYLYFRFVRENGAASWLVFTLDVAALVTISYLRSAISTSIETVRFLR